MLLAIDVGNTQTVVGVFAPDLVQSARAATDPHRTSDEWAAALAGLLALKGVTFADIDALIVSSVVPSATRALGEMSSSALKIRPLFVGPDMHMSITLDYEDPREIGADRIVNAEAAYTLHGAPVVIVDFGTATTFDVVSEKGAYLGGAIAPGIEVATDALFEKAARLSKIELAGPGRVIGKNTVESLRSGVIYGFAGQVDQMVARILAELGADQVKVVVTGGLAPLVKDVLETKHTYDADLTLKGLKLLYDQNK